MATMNPIEVRPVAGKAEMKTFIRLPGEIMAGDPNWIEPLHFERSQFFSPKHNPWFTHGDATYFLAWREGRPVGRISAQIDRLSPKLRSITILRYVENLSYDEIAETLEISLGTVKSRLARAHEALDRELSPVLHKHYLG